MGNTVQQRLAAVQADLKAPKGQYNSFGKYSYRSCEDILEAVKPLLAKNELTLILEDSLELSGDWHYVKATATVQDSNGASLSAAAFAREPDCKRGMDESQTTGSASSYARKYALNGLFCIDDAKDADTDAYQLQNGAEDNSEPTNSEAVNNVAPTTKTRQNAPRQTICECCGKPVDGIVMGDNRRTADQVADYSQSAYGKILCWNCLKKQNANGGNRNA